MKRSSRHRPPGSRGGGRRKHLRGSSLIEVMFAGAILLLGLVGILQLLISGKSATRDPRVTMTATVLTNGVLAEISATPYAAIDAGVYDAGTVIGVDGRSYPRSVTITQIGDAGFGAYRVEATTGWKDYLGRSHTSFGVIIVSETPDAAL